MRLVLNDKLTTVALDCIRN